MTCAAGRLFRNVEGNFIGDVFSAKQQKKLIHGIRLFVASWLDRSGAPTNPILSALVPSSYSLPDQSLRRLEKSPDLVWEFGAFAST